MRKVVLSVIGIVCLSFVVFMYLGSVFTDQYFSENLEELKHLGDEQAAKFDSTIYNELPKPINLILSTNVKDANKFPKLVEIEFSSLLKTDNDSPFLPFTINQFYSTRRPEYLLDGSIETNDFITIRSLESFIGGKGNLLNKLFSSITVSDAKGPQINQNGLTRYLIESVFYPSIYLNNLNFSFNAIDSGGVEVSISADTLKSKATFFISETGETTKIITRDKFRTTRLGYTKMLHETHFSDYKFFGNFKVPTRIEHHWVSEDSVFTYHKINVVSVEYQY